MLKNLKICIISEYAYSILTGIGTDVGGAELQMKLLGSELLNRNYDVSFVTFGNSLNRFEKINGFKLYNPYNIKNSGYTHIKPHNIYKLFQILKNIDADIYIQRVVSPLTGFIALFSKLRKKKFIYSVGSDYDVSLYMTIKKIEDLNKILFKVGVKLSNHVTCQSAYQKNLLEDHGINNTTLIKNIYIHPLNIKGNNNVDNEILWVGRVVKEKNPELYLKLARSMPEYKFVMIGSPSQLDYNYYKFISRETKKISNLRFLGFVPHEKLDDYYLKSYILVNTSPIEGFPNTFLEAWGNSIPVVSFVDPDKVISNNKLGLLSNDFEGLKQNTIKLLQDEKLRKQMGNNGRKYVLREHDLHRITDEYQKLFESLMN